MKVFFLLLIAFGMLLAGCLEAEMSKARDKPDTKKAKEDPKYCHGTLNCAYDASGNCVNTIHSGENASYINKTTGKRCGCEVTKDTCVIFGGYNS